MGQVYRQGKAGEGRSLVLSLQEAGALQWAEYGCGTELPTCAEHPGAPERVCEPLPLLMMPLLLQVLSFLIFPLTADMFLKRGLNAKSFSSFIHMFTY